MELRVALFLLMCGLMFPGSDKNAQTAEWISYQSNCVNQACSTRQEIWWESC